MTLKDFCLQVLENQEYDKIEEDKRLKRKSKLRAIIFKYQKVESDYQTQLLNEFIDEYINETVN